MNADAYLMLPSATRSAMREMNGVKEAPRITSKSGKFTGAIERELATGKNARKNTGGAFGKPSRRKSFSVYGNKARRAA